MYSFLAENERQPVTGTCPMSTSKSITRPLTLGEYLRVEAGSVRRHEFIAGQMYLVPHASRRQSLIIEVLSPSTAAVDQREKLMVYRQFESLQTYLVVDQEKRRVMHHRRDETGAWWRGELTSGEDRIPIRCLGMELTLDQICQGIV